jgi:ketosteroid isomerase-like protein
MDEAVLRADDARYRAMIAGDLVALDALLCDELSYTHSSALCEGKREYLASLAGGRFRYRQVVHSERRVRVLGDFALIDGTVRLHADVDGAERVLDNRFLSVWAQSPLGWRMLAWASTPRPAAG